MERVRELKALLGNELQRVSQQIINATPSRLHVSAAERQTIAHGLQERAALLGQLIAGLAIVDPALLESDGAAYGSTVVTEDMDTGKRAEYTLMVGELVDVDAGQVSLGSPIGQALLGAVEGDVIAIETPQRFLRLRVTGIIPIEWLVRNAPDGVPVEESRVRIA